METGAVIYDKAPAGLDLRETRGRISALGRSLRERTTVGVQVELNVAVEHVREHGLAGMHRPGIWGAFLVTSLR